MNYCSDIKCQRITSCDYPCEKYTDHIINLSLNNNDKKEIVIMDYDIKDVLIYDVSDPSYLEIVNGLRMPSDAINFRLLLEYMSEKNEEFCKEEGLCETCRSELVEVKESRGEHFGRECYERIVVCPKCG